jgi:ATP-dependent Lhr-like helicase
LPARLEGYEPAWLDAHCIAGRAMWARLTPPANGKGRARAVTPVRSTPIALLDRRCCGSRTCRRRARHPRAHVRSC